mmetsp:Transcript_88811/g.176550  ORF Transcript_88811/g.176550 Transcript_88811/m.176550 type:complete len:578 (-) Transcript_88811:103-1836(-)
MGRRIDALYCTKESSSERIQEVIEQIQRRAEEARQEVEDAISERVTALEERCDELCQQIAQTVTAKVEGLERQLKEIQAGTAPAAEPEDPDAPLDPNLFVLCSDAIISFQLGENDFKDKIREFGIIDEASTYASRSFAKGPAAGVIKVGMPTHLFVYACNREGMRRADGGDRVVATLSHPDDFENVSVEDLKDGRYKVTLTALKSGNYNLDIAVGAAGAAEALPTGPLPIVVQEPTEFQHMGSEEQPDGKAKVGESTDEQKLADFGSLHHPSGIDFDHTDKYFFVAEQSNHRVQVFDATDNRPITMFGKKGAGPSDFDSPGDVVADSPWKHADPTTRLVVADLLNHRLQVLEFNYKSLRMRALRTVGCRGEGDGEFQFPKGLALTDQGLVLVCDSGNHRVQVFNMLEDFAFVRAFGQHGTDVGQFTAPLDVALNTTGEVLVSDSCHRIQVFDIEGNFLRSFGSRGKKPSMVSTKAFTDAVMFDHPTNIVVSDENKLFVCDQNNHRVLILDATSGSLCHQIKGKKKQVEAEDGAVEGDGEDGERQPEWVGLHSPAGIAVSSKGEVLVSSYLKNCIHSF